ncbi:MAG: phosphoglycerate mutase [Burkholderiaceae bacterium]
MSETATHLLIPFASISSALSSEAAAKYVQDLKLPNLRQLLSTLTLVDSDIGTEESFSPPHERALARAQGLPVVDGGIPWAAQKAMSFGLELAQTQPWSFVTLCNSVVGMGSMTMEDPAQLPVSDAESRQLFSDMTPYFAEDGLTLHYLEPKLWLCCGEPLRSVRTASLDRVIGKDLRDWQPADGEAAKLRRLQNEMQMMLYINTVNNARSRVNAAVINSVYFHGNGELGGELNAELSGGSGKVSTNITTSVNMPRSLADAALKEDWPAWVLAWQVLDATACADLLKRVQAGEPVTLTLCGERSALTYELRPKSALERLKSSFRGILGLQPAYLLTK